MQILITIYTTEFTLTTLSHSQGWFPFFTLLPSSRENHFSKICTCFCTGTATGGWFPRTSPIMSTLLVMSCFVFYTIRTFFSSVPWRDSHHICLFLLAELFVLFPTRPSSSHISSSFSSWENRDSLAVAHLHFWAFDVAEFFSKQIRFLSLSTGQWFHSVGGGNLKRS